MTGILKDKSTSEQKFKISAVFGTRPEAIKLAPVIDSIKDESKLELTTIATGQHEEMLTQMLSNFSIKPDFNLRLMQKQQSLADLTGRAVSSLGKVFRDNAADLVVVHGDTTTTLSASLAAYYEQIPVAHVEAGLRSDNKYSPFPEEMNRQLTDTLADLYFAPTRQNKENLLQENIPADNIYLTGNTVIDSARKIAEQGFSFTSSLAKIIKNKDNKEIILLTTHRRENIGEDMKNIFSATKEIVNKFPAVEVVFPVHLNPAVQKLARKKLGDNSRIHLLEPLDYSNFINLLAVCSLVLTDSGGIQEEAPAFDVPVVLLRETTERPEAIEAGTVIKAGVNRKNIVELTTRLLTEEEFYEQTAGAPNPYGDGKAAPRIVQYIMRYLGFDRHNYREFKF